MSSSTTTTTTESSPTIAPSAGIETYDYHTKEQGDVLRDTQLRYLAFAQRILRVVSADELYSLHYHFRTDNAFCQASEIPRVHF